MRGLKVSVSGLNSALLNYCEEVVWLRRTHRRSGIRHLFIIRGLLLFCTEILVVAGRLWSTEPLQHLRPQSWRWNYEIIYITSKNTAELIGKERKQKTDKYPKRPINTCTKSTTCTTKWNPSEIRASIQQTLPINSSTHPKAVIK